MKKIVLAIAVLAFILTATYQTASAQNWASPANDSPTSTNTDPTNSSLNKPANTGKSQEKRQEKEAQKETAQEERQERSMERVRNRLSNAIDRMIRHLNNLKNRVQNHPNIDDDAEDQILDRLNRDIDWLEARKDELEDISSVEDLQEHRDQIRDYWSTIRGEARYITGHILVARARHFAARLEEIIGVIEEEIEELQEQGKSTLVAEDLIAQAEEHLANAKVRFEKALTTFGEIETIRDSFDLFQTGHNYLKEARQEAIKALHLVRQAVVEVKKLSRPKVSIQPTASPSGEEVD